MKKTNLAAAILLGAAVLLASGCTKTGDSKSTIAENTVSGRESKNLTTDTGSADFESREEKLAFLEQYLVMPSGVLDAEYHIKYYDNSGGLVPGPSDWDIRVAMKVNSGDIDLWTADMNKILPEQVDFEWWEDLKTDSLQWGDEFADEYYKRPGEQSYLVVYRESDIVLKYVSTLSLPIGLAGADAVNEVSGYEEYKHVVADALGYDDSTIPYIKTYQVSRMSTEREPEADVLLYTALFNNNPFIYGTPVLVVHNGDEILCEVLPYGLYDGEIQIADVTGDGYDEILIRYAFGYTGGAGTHQTAVYQLAEGGVKELFSQPAQEDMATVTTGFYLTLSDGYLYKIQNKYTDFELEFTREDENPYFDNLGNITDEAKEHNAEQILPSDHFFYKFDPVDIDGDGISEIMTAGYTHLWGRSDGIGSAYTILKWNNATREFEIVNTGFWPYEDYADNQQAYEDYIERWEEYEVNWYKH